MGPSASQSETVGDQALIRRLGSTPGLSYPGYLYTPISSEIILEYESCKTFCFVPLANEAESNRSSVLECAGTGASHTYFILIRILQARRTQRELSSAVAAVAKLASAAHSILNSATRVTSTICNRWRVRNDLSLL